MFVFYLLFVFLFASIQLCKRQKTLLQIKNKGGFIMNTTTQNNVASNATQNNVATLYTIFDIQTTKQCKVKYDGNTYNAKLLNTNPSTHLYFTCNNTKYDVILPSIITNENGEKFSTKTTIANYEGNDNQTRFANMLSKITKMSFTFDKSTQAKATRNNTKSANANTMQYINNNEQLKAQFDNLKFEYEQTKAQFEIAQKHYTDFINECKQKATQQKANDTIQILLNSGILTAEQLQNIIKGGAN